MSTDEYVPNEQDLEVAWIESEASADDINEASAEFDRFLARVRRDAEAELDSWMTRAYEAEGKLWKAEADRDWNLRSSRLAKQERIEANARADQAEARIEAWEKQYAHDLEQADAHIDAAEARIKAVQDVLDRKLPPSARTLAAEVRRAMDGG